MVVDTLPSSILLYPHPDLRRKCARVESFDPSLASLAERMFELMHAGPGVGLAGPQVGVCLRVFAWNPTGEPADDHFFVNPEPYDLTGSVAAEEGCLSIPEVTVEVRRARRCRIRAFDVSGQPIDVEGEDLVARIWQHETDHLDGRLIIDRMSSTERLANRKLLTELETRYRRKSRVRR